MIISRSPGELKARTHAGLEWGLRPIPKGGQSLFERERGCSLAHSGSNNKHQSSLEDQIIFVKKKCLTPKLQFVSHVVLNFKLFSMCGYSHSSDVLREGILSETCCSRPLSNYQIGTRVTQVPDMVNGEEYKPRWFLSTMFPDNRRVLMPTQTCKFPADLRESENVLQS